MPTDDDIDGLLVWNAVRFGRRLERLATDRLADVGLTPMQFGVLVYVSARPGMTQSELARVVEVRPQSIRETVATMRGRGLVQPGGEQGPGKRSALHLTDEGREQLTRAWPAIAGVDAAALGISQGDERELNRLIRAVLHATP